MTQFDLKNYVQVNDRVQKFWKEHPEGRVVTEVTHLDPAEATNRMVIVRAKVYLDSVATHPASTGLAKEREGTSGANKTAFLENAETSAIGRALANLGYLIDKNRASREEMEAVQQAEAEHKVALDRIKAIAKDGSEEIKNEVRAVWSNLKEDPVATFSFLDKLEVATAGI